MSYFSFFFRIIVALVFWKDSLDFTRIVKNQQDQTEVRNAGNSSPDKIRSLSYKKAAEDIAKQYKGYGI